MRLDICAISTLELPTLRRVKPVRAEGVTKKGSGKFIGTGLEPAKEPDLSVDGGCICNKPTPTCAERALHSWSSSSLPLATIDAELRQLITTWDEIPRHAKESALALSQLRSGDV